MHHFAHRDGVLHAEDVAVPDIAAAVGTPFYCYSTATLTRHYRVFDDAFAGLDHMICYAMKANSNQAVIATLARLGAGADVVSEGELRRALAAGVPAEKILFSGVGKTARELAFALDADIHCFNVESEPELELLSEIAAAARRGRAGQPAHQSGRRRRHARKDLHRPQGEQVRHPLRPRPRRLCPGGGAARHPGRRHRHAYRQPDHRAGAVRQRLRAALRARAGAARRRPRHRARRSRRRPRHSLPRGRGRPAAPHRLCRYRQKAHEQDRLPGDLRARAPDRRQCRHPGHARCST